MVHSFTETKGRNPKHAFRRNGAELVRVFAFRLAIGVCFLLEGGQARAAEQAQEKPPAKTEAAAPAAPFKQPRSLPELLAVKSEDLDKVDIALMNLLCAEGLRGSENLDPQECL